MARTGLLGEDSTRMDEGVCDVLPSHCISIAVWPCLLLVRDCIFDALTDTVPDSLIIGNVSLQWDLRWHKVKLHRSDATLDRQENQTQRRR